MTKSRAAIIGAGSFGRHHARVISQLPDVELAAIIDPDLGRAQQLAQEYHCKSFADAREIGEKIDAAIVVTPTVTHNAVATPLLESGVDVLIEKPMAESASAGERMTRLAQERGRILQVGHLERFNPAVMALEKVLTIPLFFEIHRLSVFTPRSLDIDVVLDLMIHDLDIVLSFTKQLPVEIRAAGISVLSNKVDIANVRLSFATGCIANLTASRVSTEKVRKLRLFQPGEYLSIDYTRQQAIRLRVQKPDNPGGPIAYESLAIERGEPLTLELISFFSAVRNRTPPRVDGFQAVNALQVAEAIVDKIKEHAELVSRTVEHRS